MARVKFRYQKPYSKTYRVGLVDGTQPDCQFTTIQAAINQAVADGHTSNANRALIEIYPKNGGYAEDLTLASGVDLIGMDASQVDINGNAVYAPVAGNRNTNRIRINNIAINGNAGADTFTLGGTAGLEITFIESFINRELEDGFIALRKTNTQGSGGGANRCQLTFRNAGVYLFDSVNPGLDAVVLQNGGQLNATGYLVEFGSEGGAGNATFNLQGDSRVNINGNNTFASLYGDQKIFELHDTSQVNLSFAKVISNIADAIIFDYVDNCGVDAVHCHLGVFGANAKIANGAAGSINLVGSTYNGQANQGDNYISPGIFINVGANSPRSRSLPTGETELTVGGENGFATIQEAIDFANVTGGPGSYIIKINPGSYNENLTLDNSNGINNFTLVGNTSLNVRARPNFGTVNVGIVGQVNIDSTSVYFQNISFEQVLGSSCIALTGATGGVLKFGNCSFVAQTADAVSVIDIANNTLAYEFFMNGCSAFIVNAVGNKYFLDMNNGITQNPVFAKSCNFTCSSTDEANPVTTVRVKGTANFEECNFGGNSSKMVEILANSSFISFGSEYGVTSVFNVGSVFKFNGVGASVESFQDSYRILATSPGAQIARNNGTQATALIAQTSNVYAPGDGYDINGANFVNGVDFTVGGTAAITAQNLAQAINISANVNILNKIYAIANGDNVELYDYSYSTAGNAYTLTLIGTAPATLTPWGGGANGDAGLFVYALNVFQYVNKIQNAITLVQAGTTLIPSA